MRLRRAKSEPEGLRDRLTDSLDALRGGAHRRTVLKAALITGGVAALTAGSAAISSFRRRMEAD
jgi:hypothetical protein